MPMPIDIHLIGSIAPKVLDRYAAWFECGTGHMLDKTDYALRERAWRVARRLAERRAAKVNRE